MNASLSIIKSKSKAALVFVGLLTAWQCHAQVTWIKANNTTALNTDGSWVASGVPASGDIGRWDSTVTAANTVALGGAFSIGELMVVNPTGLVTLSDAANTLTLNGVSGTGIDMTSASQNLALTVPLALGGNQFWNIVNGRTVTHSGASGITFGTSILTISGGGTFIANERNNPTLASSSTAGAGIVVNGSTLSCTIQTSGTSAAYANYLGANTAFTIAGGSMVAGEVASSGNHSQAFTSLTLNPGYSSFSLTARQSSSGNAVSFATLTRNVGSIADFGSGSVSGSSKNQYALVGSAVPGYATFALNDWVLEKGTGTIVSGPTYVSDTWASGNNTTVTTSSSPAPASTTGTLRFGTASTTTTISSGASGQNTIVVASAANLGIGAGVSGTGIPANTTITGISGTTITLSANLTATATGTLTYGPSTASTVTLSGNNVITTGGILNNFYSGSNGETLTGGNLTSGNTTSDGFHDLICINNNPISGGNLVINSAITDNGANAVGLTKAGAGALVLGGVNTFTGPSYINAGTVQLNGASAWSGSSALNFAPNGTLTGAAGVFSLNGNSASVGGLATTQTGLNPTVQNSNATPATLTVAPASGSKTFSGTIQNGAGVGALSLVKNGAGTQTIGGTLSYSGSTTVSAGTLALTATPSATTGYAVNGTLDVTALSSSTLALASPQTLSGSGTVSGNVSVASGAHTRPGALGVTNTITGNLTYNTGAKADFDLNTSAVNGPNDQIVLSGTSSVLTCGGVAININLMGATLDTTTDYVLFKLTGGSASISGTFNPVPTWLGTVPANSGGYSIVTDSVNKRVLLHFVNAVAPAVAGSASPSTVVRNQNTLVSVTVTPGSGTVTNVYLDLTLINGTNFVPLTLSGTPNVYTNTITIPAAAVVGSTHIVANAADTTPLTGSGNVALTINASTETWNGLGGSDNWSDNGNWVSGLAPGIIGDSLIFDGSNQLTPNNIDNSYTVSALDFDSTAGAFTVTTANSSVLTLAGGLTNESVNAQTLNVPVAISGTQPVNTLAGDITLGGAVTGGGLNKLGAGTLFLGSGGNTYSGNTTISNGAVSINQSASIGGGNINLAGGALSSGYSSITRLTLANAFSVPAGNTGVINMSTLNRLNGTLTGSGVLNINAPGTQDDLAGSWNGFTGQVNFFGGGICRWVINGGSFNGFGLAFVTMTNETVQISDNSTGNTFALGAINEDSTATIAGPYQGNSPNFVIGGLNQNDVLAGAIQNSTRITKVGTGNLTIASAGTATYNGQTIVSNGTLTVNGQISASQTTNYNGATIAGNGSLFVVDLELGSYISPGVAGVGTLSCGGDLTFNGGTNVVDISTNNGHDLIAVSGNLNLVGGGVRLVPSTVLTNGTYPLITYTGTLTGSAGNLTLAGFSQSGQTAVLSDATPGEIDLIVAAAGAANLTWASAGAQNNIWDLVNSVNWNIGAAFSTFSPGDHVTFNNAGAGNTTVDVRAIVQPSTTTVTGSQAYLLESTTGGGKLSGATNSLVLTGTGSLELDILSDYGGPTTIGSGTTLTVGNGADAASIGTGLITNNGALVFNQTNNLALTNIVGTGTGTLTKNGTSTLTLTANNTYSWTTIGSGATLQVGAGGATGSLGSGSVTNDGKLVYNKTGTFSVGNVNTGPANGGELDFLGAANVALNNGNTYVNNTVVDGGVVKLNANEVIPSAATVPSSTGWLVLDGSATVAGTLDMNGFNQTVNALSGLGSTTNGLITNSAAATTTTNILTVLGTAATTYAGTIADNSTGAKIALVLRGANQLELHGANSYSGGTIVGDTAALALHNNGAAGSGGILMSNGTSLRMNAAGGSGDPSIFPGNTVNLVSGASATFTSRQIANGYGISVVGDATTTAIIGGATNDTVSFSSGGVEQFQSMLGTVVVPANSALRWSATTAANGGDSATFDVEGTMTSKAGTLSLGALTGAGTVDGGGGITYTVGLKGIDTTFTGTLQDNGAGIFSLTKAGAGKLTLSGTVSYTGNSTVNGGTLALVDPVSLDNSTNINLGGGTINVSGRADNTVNLGNLKPQNLSGIGNITGNLGEASGSSVRPGLGVMAVSGSATLSGNIVMQLNITNTPATNSEITAASFSISGPLTVTNVGPALQGGDTFQLFNHAVTGFTVTNLPVLSGGMIWTNKLAINGSIAVIATVNTTPTNLTSVVTGGGTTLTLSWPADHTGWRLQVQTNALGVGLKPASSAWVTVPGSTSVNSVIVPLNPNNATVFYRMVYP